MLRGKRFVITGANTGVGRATAVELARRGGDVVLLCRRLTRAAAVVAEIDAIPSAGACEVIEMDLADLSSVRHAASRVMTRFGRLDVLINNAGVGGARGLTRDGFEMAFGVNHLGHYLLTHLLLPGLSSDGRVVHLSSGSHARARELDFGSFVRPTRSLTGVREYAASKLCVMLFHHHLAARFERTSSHRVSVAADPGDVASDAYRHVPQPFRYLITHRLPGPAVGARTSLFCAVDEEVGATGNGGFYVDRRLAVPSPLSRDGALARRLDAESARMVGLAP